MSRTSYLTHTQVSGPSTWMGELVRTVEGVVGGVKGVQVEGSPSGERGGVEGKKYVRNFLDKCCRWIRLLSSGMTSWLLTAANISLILAKFTGALVKSRPLKEIGAEQASFQYIFW